jgi:hypothetical protein
MDYRCLPIPHGCNWVGWLIPNFCWSSPAQLFLVPSPMGLMTTFYSLRFEAPPTRRTRVPYLYPPGIGWPSYTTRHWVTFSSPPTTRRATEEVFEPASARGSVGRVNCCWFRQHNHPWLQSPRDPWARFLDLYVFRNGTSSSTKEGSVFLCRRYICFNAVSARGHPHCHGVQATMGSVHPLSLHYTK